MTHQPTAAPKTPRWLLPLFLAVAALHLLPIWRVHYVPTVDGPSHLYNAVVLRELAADTPEFERLFRADLRPHPNWLTHLMLAAAMGVAPPLVAEKLVFSAIVLLFLIGCWRLAGAVDPASKVHTFLVMPLAFHLLLQMGFYNYSMSVSLVPFALASWWRRRENPSGRGIAITAAWLVLCYFAHVLPTAAAVLFVFLASCVSALIRGWRTLGRNLLCLVPVTSLLAWFFLQPKLPGGTWTWQGSTFAHLLAQTWLLQTFDPRQLLLGKVIAGTLAALIVVTFAIENVDWKRRRLAFRERDVFLLLTIAAVTLFLAAPLSVQEGLVLKARLLILPYLVVLPWLTGRLRFAYAPLAVIFALVAAANVFLIRDYWKRGDKLIAPSLAPFRAAAPLHTIVPLVFDRTTPWPNINLLSHAMSYGAAEHRLVDFGNYEAGLGFFPVQFQPDARRPTIYEIEAFPGQFDPNAWAEQIDYIYTWKMPPDAPVAQRLDARYVLVADDGDARLYERRGLIH